MDTYDVIVRAADLLSFAERDAARRGYALDIPATCANLAHHLPRDLNRAGYRANVTVLNEAGDTVVTGGWRADAVRWAVDCADIWDACTLRGEPVVSVYARAEVSK